MNQNWKNDIASVSEMAQIWNISKHYLKNLCNQGKVDCKKMGNTWVVYKIQPKPVIQQYKWKNTKTLEGR